MSMAMRHVIVLLWTCIHFLGSSGDENRSLTHDFRTGHHGWFIGDNWRWSGDSGFPTNINTGHVQLSKEGNCLWIQKTNPWGNSSSLSDVVYYDVVYGVTNQTKFQVNYLIDAIDASCAYFNFLLASPRVDIHFRHTVHRPPTYNWTTYTVDCAQDHCCNQYNCDLLIMVKAFVECSDANSLIAIRSVSTTGIVGKPYRYNIETG